MKGTSLLRTRLAAFGRAALLCAAVGAPARAVAAEALQSVEIRLATLVPRGTSYYQHLMAMGEKWRQATGGAVRLTVYPNGVKGVEHDIVEDMQIGNLNAGLLSAVGLSYIESDVIAFESMPMAFRSLDELDYVAGRLRPQFDRLMLAKGYVVLFWSDMGWVRFFSTRRVLHPDDLRGQKLFCWAGNPEEADAWRSLGFTPIVLDTSSIPLATRNHTIDAVPMPPSVALESEVYSTAKYMFELNWGVLVGAAVVRRQVWEGIPPATRERLLAIALEAGRLIKRDARAEGDASVSAMAARGLIVTKSAPEIDAEWQARIDKARDWIRGRIVPAGIYDETERLLAEYRAGRRAP